MYGNGDVRVTPSYTNAEVQEFVSTFIEELDVRTLNSTGYGSFELPDGQIGRLFMEFTGDPAPIAAVNLTSPSYQVLADAIEEVRGSVTPVSTGGSLPVIGDLFELGFDVQMTGFGVADNIHAANEFGFYTDFADGYRVLAILVDDFAAA